MNRHYHYQNYPQLKLIRGTLIKFHTIPKNNREQRQCDIQNGGERIDTQGQTKTHVNKHYFRYNLSGDFYTLTAIAKAVKSFASIHY